MSKHISNQQNNEERSEKHRSADLDTTIFEVERQMKNSWPETTLHQFNNVDLHTTDESNWYGPWNTVLHHLFLPRYLKDTGEVTGFQVSPQHIKSGSRLEPDYTIYYLVTWGVIPICVVEVKPYDHLMGDWGRTDAYEQLEARLRFLNNRSRTMNDEVPVVYGLQCMGPQFMVMELTIPEGKLSPSYDRRVIHPDYGKPSPPEAFWAGDVRTVEGACRLVEMAAHVYEMISNIPGMPLQEGFTAVDAVRQLSVSIKKKK